MADDRETERVTERTTVVQTGARRGGGGTIALLALIALLLLGLYMFRDELFGGAADSVKKVEIDIDANGS